MDQILSMRAFARVVETGTFTQAASSLDMPKGTVTKLVQQLEARLKVRLLNRTTRRVTVTPDGAAYYERTLRLLNDLDDIEASMSNAHATPSGRIRVDVGTSIARHIIIPALPSFYARYPDIQLDLGVSDRLVDLMTEGVDCVLRAGDLTDQSLVARRIGNIHLVALASADYIRQYGMPEHPRDLEGGRHRTVNYLAPRASKPYLQEYEKDGERFEILGRNHLAVNEANAYTQAIILGLGIGQTAAFAVGPQLESGELVRVLPEWSRPAFPIYVVYPPNRHLSAKVRAFVDWAADLFARNKDLQGG
ncbi:MAG: LysR family transcriptional regulator [Comamonadaceae bacterium]|nr:MAG: LysR family transcriptional regulator [Comamonadaceae bacterium]